MKTSSFSQAVIATIGVSVSAQSVVLREATATYSQPNYAVTAAIDSSLDTGWAIATVEGTTSSQVAVFETAQDVTLGPNMILAFTLKSGGFPGANLGRFRISVTGDDRSNFADGLINNGDVTAQWEVLDPHVFKSYGGATLTKLEDYSILAGGTNVNFDTYRLVAVTKLPRITGVRLEVMEDSSLPTGGPGRHANGNVVVYNIAMSALPSIGDLISTINVSSVDICWEGVPGKSYQVQYRSELTDNLWSNLGPPVVGNGTNRVTDIARDTEKRFYQVKYRD